MSTVLASFLGKLNDTQKALVVIASSVAFGVTVTVAGFAYIGLPDELEALQETVGQNTEATQANALAIERLNQTAVRDSIRHESLVCLLTLPDSVSPIRARRECGA